MKCKILVMTMFLISSFVQSQCYAAYTVYDPRNHAANVETKAQMIQQVLNSAKQLEYQLKNMESLDWSDLAAVDRNCTYIFGSIESIRKQSDAIGEDWIATLGEWSEANPDYDKWDSKQLERYSRQAQRNRERWEKTLRQGLVMAGLNSMRENARTADEVLSVIRASNNSQGTVQALQAATQLNGLQIAELEKMQAMVSEMLKVKVMERQMLLDESKRAKKQTEDFFNGNKDAIGKDVKIRNRGDRPHDLRIH